MGATVAFVTILVLGEVGVVAGVGWWAVRRRRACSPTGIAHRLGRPGTRHVVQLRGYRGTWNPAKPIGPVNALFGPGIATYSKDADSVHLEWQPRSGSTEHLAGPFPAFAVEGTPAYIARRRMIRAVLVVLGGFGAIVVVGCGVGYFVSTGSSGARLTTAAIGGGATFLIVQVAFQGWRIIRGVRRRDAQVSGGQPSTPRVRDSHDPSET